MDTGVLSAVCVRSVRRQLTLLVSCLVLAACVASSPSQADSASLRGDATQPTPTPTASSTTVVRTLDFDDDRVRGEQVFAVPYGEARSRLGYIPPCNSCADPCPCTVPLQPSSFDVDSGGHLWILDVAKERAAEFDSDSTYVSSWKQKGIGLRSTDLQVDESRQTVLWQDRAFFSRLAIREDGSGRSVRVEHEGEPQQGGSTFVLHGDVGYLNVFIEQQPGSEEESVLAFSLADGGGDIAKGRPFLDGWLLFRPYEGPRLIPLAVESTHYEWDVTLKLQTRRSVDGESRTARGHVSWETEVSPDGDIHLLIAASIEKDRLHGYWYIGVSPDGTVSKPVPLSGPTRRDDQQARRLTLSSDGTPLFMWSMKKRIVVESLPPV